MSVKDSDSFCFYCKGTLLSVPEVSLGFHDSCRRECDSQPNLAIINDKVVDVSNILRLNVKNFLSDDIGFYKNLKWLELEASRNEFVIPASLSNLENLESIKLETSIYGKFLTREQTPFPDSLKEFRAFYAFKSFPNISNLKNLEVLIANNCLVNEIDLSNFRKLRKLDLSNSGNNWYSDWSNSLVLLKGIKNLRDLEVLNVRRNNLQGSVDLSECSKLTDLSLGYNDLSVFPDVRGLNLLTSIHIEYNKKITEIPDYVLDLPSLEKICVEGTGLLKVPNVSDSSPIIYANRTPLSLKVRYDSDLRWL